MWRLLPTDVLCEIVSHSSEFTCDYYPTEQIFLYQVDPVKHFYGHDPISREPTLLFKTIYVTVKADVLPVGDVGFQVRMLPDVRKVVFYTEKKPRDVVRGDFPIHALQKRMDPHWDLKTVNDMADLPMQFVQYQYPDWRAREIKLVSERGARQLTELFGFFDGSVRYPIKLVLIAPEPADLDVDVAIYNMLKKFPIRNYIYQIQYHDTDPGPFRRAFKWTLSRVDIPDVEGTRLGLCHYVKRHLVSTATKNRALASIQQQQQPKQETYRQTMTFADAPEWIIISWRLLRNRPDINILWKTFYADWLTEGKDIADENEFNKKMKELGRIHRLSALFMTLWTRYLLTKSTAIHIMWDKIGRLLDNAFRYGVESEKYMLVQNKLAKWSEREQWVSKPVVALIVYIPGHAATLAYFRSQKQWVYYDTGRSMYFDFISDIVYLLNQYVDPSDLGPKLCTLVDSPGQKREIFWVRYGECSLHAAGRLELLSQGIFDPMARVDTTAVRQKLLSIMGVYGGFLARYIEKLLEDTNVPPGKVARLWQRHEADVRKLYKVNPTTRQNIKRLYYMHSFDNDMGLRSNDLDLVVSPVSGVVEGSIHADREDGGSEDWLQVYIRGPHDEVQDDHRIFAPTSGVLTYTTRRMRSGDTFFEADPGKLGILIAQIGSVEFKVFVGRGYVTDEIRMDVQSGSEVQKGQVIGEIIVRPGNSRAEISVPSFIWDDFLSKKVIGLVLEGGKTVIGEK